MGRITLNIPRPPSVNSSNAIIPVFSKKAGKTVPRRIKTRDFKTWIKEAGLLTNCQRLKPILGQVIVEIEVTRPSSGRRADIDNIIKHCLDLLVDHRLIADDSKVESVKASWVYRPDAPECRVVVSELTPTVA